MREREREANRLLLLKKRLLLKNGSGSFIQNISELNPGSSRINDASVGSISTLGIKTVRKQSTIY